MRAWFWARNRRRQHKCRFRGSTCSRAHIDVATSSIYSFNVQSEVTRLELLHQSERSAFAFPDVRVSLGPRVIVVLGGDGYIVALDVHTRTQFLVPSFINAFLVAVEVGPPPFHSCFTSTT